MSSSHYHLWRCMRTAVESLDREELVCCAKELQQQYGAEEVVLIFHFVFVMLTAKESSEKFDTENTRCTQYSISAQYPTSKPRTHRTQKSGPKSTSTWSPILVMFSNLH